MKILVTGAAGMVGRKLCEHLSRDDNLGGKPISKLHMVDVIAPALADAPFPATGEAADTNYGAIREYEGRHVLHEIYKQNRICETEYEPLPRAPMLFAADEHRRCDRM